MGRSAIVASVSVSHCRLGLVCSVFACTLHCAHSAKFARTLPAGCPKERHKLGQKPQVVPLLGRNNRAQEPTAITGRCSSSKVGQLQAHSSQRAALSHTLGDL